MHPSLFTHPEDRAAMENLKAMPLLPQVMKAFLKVFNEQLMHGINMASKIRLSERQLPELYQVLPPICQKLGVAEPEFYLEMNPLPNAYTFGESRTFITVTSGLLEHTDADELQAVIAHECGHIACRHVLYHTMGTILAQQGLKLLGPLALPAQPVVWALLYWQRRSEFSADRAAAYVMGGPESIVQTMIRLSGGPKSLTANINYEEYLAQAESYNRLNENDWDQILQILASLNDTHPFSAVRAREISNWCSTSGFAGLMTTPQSSIDSQSTSGCASCHQPIQPAWAFCMHCGAKLGSS